MNRTIGTSVGMNELITFMERFLEWTQKATSNLRTYGP